MGKIKIEPFMVAGIAVRTTNAKGKAAKDIGALWNKFMDEDIQSKIPNKADSSIYAIYTDYEGDHNHPYTMILGCKVNSSKGLPSKLISRHFIGGNHLQYIAKGDLTKNAVHDVWQNIWASDLKRIYTADIEIYGEKAKDPTNGEAEILIAVEN